jgi:acyl-CoA reductase-like NAD-dependent aldehyde dehydrogenase
MRQAHRLHPLPTIETRLNWLNTLERLVTEYEAQFIAAMQSDFSHRSTTDCMTLDLGTSLSQIRMAKHNLKRWMAPKSIHVPLAFKPARAQLRPQPRGVVGVMAPWNFPVYLAVAPAAAALAAGNRVMIKPSEMSPKTSQVLADAVTALFAPDVLTVHQGGAEVAATFSALPFDHLLFTGSTAVGRKVAAAAAQNLTPVTLELGGKSPAVVMPTADLSRAARRIMWGKTANAGQICVAPDYALVPRDLMDEFVQKAEAAMRKFYPKGAASKDYCGTITSQQLTRMTDMLDEVKSRGAKIIQLKDGKIPNGQRKFAPTIIVDPPLDCTIMREEIFGPILPVIPYETLDEALSFVAERDHPLALYVFSEDKDEQDAWLDRSISGGVTVNDTVIHVGVDTLPFGGVGASGYGAYHGKAGFETFSHMKPVLHQAKWNAMRLTEAPMTSLKARLLKVARKLM